MWIRLDVKNVRKTKVVYASYMQPNGLPNVGLIRDSVGNTIQRVGKVRSDDRRYGGTKKGRM